MDGVVVSSIRKHGDGVDVSQMIELVVRLISTHEDSNLFANDAFLRYARILECLVCAFHQNSLLRIHGGSFLLRDVEERRVKDRQVLIQEITASVVQASCFFRIRMPVTFLVES